jgi:required for meiotic nuclear division protein 1
MLPFSNGLADSVRLAHLESSFDTLWNQYINHIPAKLLQSSLSFDANRKKVLKITGLLLEFRASLYNTNIADSTISDLYWDRPDLEKLYIKMGSILETRRRFIALNRKMDYANELVGVLRAHLNEQHGLKLEWGIITLIAVEVLFEIIHMIN